MFCTDKYLDEVYHRTDNNCAHFVARVWWDLKKEDISGLAKPASMECRSNLRGIGKPVHPCIVFVFPVGSVPHIGVHIHGDVLHLSERGVLFQDLQSFIDMARKVRYYVQRR